jgi:REP element-mobilizing transposase RayT
MYHVMNRGDRREDISQDDEDRKRFLSTLGEACRKTGWQVHGYCLMRNHSHFGEVVQEAEAVQASGW